MRGNWKGLGRTLAQLQNQYEVEKNLASKLKNASREERPQIYATMYDELFARVPDHSRLTRRADPIATQRRVKRIFRLVKKFIAPSTVFLEFGPGDCALSLRVCRHVRKVYAVDISPQMKRSDELPLNFEFIVYDGYRAPVPDRSVDVVFSDQLIEHLHPEDVIAHFQTAKRVLKPGGKYVFCTPHRFTGPHDISRFFADEAEGFHLKEWTFDELSRLLKEIGYHHLRFYRFAMNLPLWMPTAFILTSEHLARVCPRTPRAKITRALCPSIVISAGV